MFSSQATAELLFARHPEPMWIHDAQTLAILEVNEAACELYGYAREEFTRLLVTDLEVVGANKDSEKSPSVHRRKNGSAMWVELSTKEIEAKGRKACLVVARNVSLRVIAEEALRLSESQHRELIDRAPVGMYRTTPEGQVLLANPALAKMLGYSSESDLAGMTAAEMAGDDYSRPEFQSLLERTGELIGYVATWRKKDGTPIVVREHARLVKDAAGEPAYFEGMVEDITEQHRLTEQLHYQAHHDALTGLSNRVALEDRLEHCLARERRTGGEMAVLAIDIDRFKEINDSYGHHVGDQCLRSFVQAFARRLRHSDTFARMGGDEFVVLLEGSGALQAQQVASALLEALRTPLRAGSRSFELSASIGIAVFPDHGRSLEELLRYADQAMYEAKALGRNRYQMFDSNIGDRVAQTRELESQLRRALANGLFFLEYQPKCTAAGEMRGVEALLRFRHTKRGLISPAEFVPVAEAAGLIVPVGSWVIDQACRQIIEWQTQGLLAVPVSVNVSALQFAQPDFAERVAEILMATQIDPSLLELELTETLVMREFSDVSSQLARLKALGLRIAVDDFGTGYSSLSYLHRLPIDVLKIDRSFVERITDDAGTRPIVSAVMALAKSIGLETVAEGVETEAQRDVLQSLGCDLNQGYLFGRPTDPQMIGAMLRAADAVPPKATARAQTPRFEQAKLALRS